MGDRRRCSRARMAGSWRSPRRPTTWCPGFGPAPHFGSFDTAEVYLRDRQSNTIVPVSVNMSGGPADRGALVDAVSADGRYVLFSSESPDLVSQPFPNGATELFLRDAQEDTTTLASTNGDGQPANGSGAQVGVMSANANVICFVVRANNVAARERPNVPELVCKNLTTGQVQRADGGLGGTLP